MAADAAPPPAAAAVVLRDLYAAVAMAADGAGDAPPLPALGGAAVTPAALPAMAPPPPPAPTAPLLGGGGGLADYTNPSFHGDDSDGTTIVTARTASSTRGDAAYATPVTSLPDPPHHQTLLSTPPPPSQHVPPGALASPMMNAPTLGRRNAGEISAADSSRGGGQGAVVEEGMGGGGLACSICHELILAPPGDAAFFPGTIVRLACGHLYHAHCFRSWIAHDGASCPDCRAPADSGPDDYRADGAAQSASAARRSLAAIEAVTQPARDPPVAARQVPPHTAQVAAPTLPPFPPPPLPLPLPLPTVVAAPPAPPRGGARRPEGEGLLGDLGPGRGRSRSRDDRSTSGNRPLRSPSTARDRRRRSSPPYTRRGFGESPPPRPQRDRRRPREYWLGQQRVAGQADEEVVTTAMEIDTPRPVWGSGLPTRDGAWRRQQQRATPTPAPGLLPHHRGTAAAAWGSAAHLPWVQQCDRRGGGGEGPATTTTAAAASSGSSTPAPPRESGGGGGGGGGGLPASRGRPTLPHTGTAPAATRDRPALLYVPPGRRQPDAAYHRHGPRAATSATAADSHSQRRLAELAQPTSGSGARSEGGGRP